MKNIKIYSDGSSLGNPGPGGWGTILSFNGHTKELSGCEDNTTNNRMELLGAIKGLEAIKEPCNVEIISDSTYVVKAINEWLNGWVKKGWKNSAKKDVKNSDLWKQYIEVSKGHNIIATWVKGHNGHDENERCDILARTAAEQLQQKLN
ncbi:MAG: ribonuclease HI [Campylobacteraceae bacterium]|jgi:ribonuclease HI|nr:ribonuclease HI [Campylobacteraceae bacterium]MBT3882014.1 ribonuclease HI [Campylobacteraceae bacterium]MBT4029984.1 ribonuclease HI [Campylobacteraceae bacterium]MBT4179944.1 ribonuclease HI [Campylobacteraceae bacterium]MBT4572248.1 ribonuclease HI [Campylobacteraceae bacterium]